MSAPRRICLHWGLTIVGLTLAIVLSHAASPIFWHVSTQAEFLEGEVENLSVDTTGRLLLGPVSEVVYETTAPFLWATAATDGVLWVGSGNDGRVFRIEDNSEGQLVFDADELNVHAVAAIDRDTAYVGTSPDGSVFRVSTSQEVQTIFDPNEQYIWALAPDGAEGDFFVATGDPGRIYRVTSNGTATLFYETNSTHVLSLAVDPNGNVLAGTGSPGRVFRITPTGEGFVVLDSPFSEIRALRLAPNGVLYAVAVSQLPGQTTERTPVATSTGSTTATVSTSVSETVSVSTSGTTSSPAVSTRSDLNGSSTSRGAVYRIMPDGVWDPVWKSATDTPYDVAFTASDPSSEDSNVTNQTLLIATGSDGKIFRVSENPPQVVLLTRAPTQQVMQFVPDSDGAHYYVTSNPGKVYRLESNRARIGTYLSTVRDAETVATWGTVRWRATTPAGTSVELFTRTGNTEEPNNTWSVWSEAYSDPAGSQVTSPKARYIQWKAQLTGGETSPVLLSVTTAYLPRNLAPEITSVTVHEPGVVFQLPFSGTDPPIAGLADGAEARAATVSRNGENQQNTLGRQVFQKGLQTFVWTTRDGNQDDLTFDVFYRTDAETVWNTLAEELRVPIFTWNTSSVPDGEYVVRVVATDALSNPPGRALRGALESKPFNIDNSPPQIALNEGREQGGETVVEFVVSDSHSSVEHVEYSLDTERWQVVYPLDGIPDSQVERFEVMIDPASADRLVIRASDAMGNTVTSLGHLDGPR